MAFSPPIWWIVPSLAAGLGTPTLGDWANEFASIDRRLMETWGGSTGPTTYARARRLDDRFGAAPSSSAARAVIPPGCPVTCAPDGPYTEVSAVPMPWFRSRPFPFDSFQSRRHPTTHPLTFHAFRHPPNAQRTGSGERGRLAWIGSRAAAARAPRREQITYTGRRPGAPVAGDQARPWVDRARSAGQPRAVGRQWR